jgi:hypothetical protein
MGLLAAGAWGMAGGLAAGLVVVSAAIAAAGYKWPWVDGTVWPRVLVTGIGVLLGAIVAGAAHGQMSGAWPAFLLGVGAPSVIRGALSGVEVAEKKPLDAAHQEGGESVA